MHQLSRIPETWHDSPTRCSKDVYFWATHAGAEIDLVVIRRTVRLAFGVKRTVSPGITRSMRIALDDLELDRIDVLHAGRDTFPLADRIRAVSTYRIWNDVEPLLPTSGRKTT